MPESRLPELPASQIFDEAVLDQLPLGVVVLDQDGYVVKYNAYEETLARRSRADVIGRNFFEDVARCTNVPEVRGRFEAGIESRSLTDEIEYAFELPFLPKPRDVRILLRSFELDDDPFGIFLIEDVTERKDLERDRESLLRVLMHDLNNPLQGILGYSSLLADGALGPVGNDDQRQALRSIEDSSLKLRRLIDGTLAELRGQERRRTRVNLHALVLSSIGNLLPQAKERGVEIHYDQRTFARTEFPDRAVVVPGEVAQLASVVQNLLSNAVKYASSAIRIDLDTASDAAYLTVRDDGPGIPFAEQARIFEEGYQAAGSLPGQGIGLYSVRRAVDAHEGQVTVESEPGEGTTFRVELPAG